MKRLLATVGLTYLSMLSVVFYFANGTFTNILIILSSLSAFVGIFFKAIKNKIRIKKTIADLLIIIGLTSFAACVSIILYSNYNYQPVINNYSDKELYIEGYVCDDVQIKENSNVYIIAAEKINNESADVKIRLTSTVDLHAEDFDRITAHLYASNTDESYLLSKGIYLTSFYNEESDSLNSTGEKHFSLYSFAVNARKAMKHSLDILLPESSSSLCKAVLLGDKQALSYGVKDDFYKTGTSFLIVVSGLHLSVITAFALFLLKKIIKNRYILFAIIIGLIFCFAAVTGFTPSVVRSGIMVALTYCSQVVSRRSDGLNSLGAAALVLVLFNPFAVGDIGMLLSFSATAGIILWAGKIETYLSRKLHLKDKHKLIRGAVNLISVSISASLWIIPIATAAFHKISPFVVLASFFTEPIVSMVLICAMLASLLYLCPVISFLAYPFALAAALLGKLFLWIIQQFASIPYICVSTDKLYFYIWLIFTALLVIIGYAVKAKGFYVRCAVTASAVVLTVGWAFYSIVSYNSATLKIYNVGSGVTASVECGSNISFISCGGESGSAYNIIDNISGDFSSLDSLIIPELKLKYSKYLPQLLSEFDVSNILVYDNSGNQKDLESYDGNARKTFGDNCHFSINLNSATVLDVINVDSVTYQYLRINGSTVLFAPSMSDIVKLPEEYRVCDYLLTDSEVNNSEMLSCKNVIFSGEKSLIENKYIYLKEISDNIYTTSDGIVELVFSGGSNVKDK